MSGEKYSRVEALFLEAVEKPPGEQTAFLIEACDGDEELFREVESLLAAEREVGDFLDEPTVRLPDGRLQQTRPIERGHVIGSYRVLSELGEGESATVYLAERADAEYRVKVAIKLVKRGMDSSQILRRFQQERQILAALDHPNIARLIDGGRCNDGRPYLVMEYIDGEKIDEYCYRRRLTVDQRLEIFQTVCAAVHFAHQSLVIHRDLKPSNIMITADGTPKLLDFGIAKLLDPELSAVRPELTATVIRLLTPRYASPEQARGEPVTTASDVYSLGVLLYELLTGRRPYRIEGLTMSQIEQVINDSRPEPPSVVVRRPLDDPAGGTENTRAASQWASFNPDRVSRRLAGDLDTIVMKALRKEPERRYGSVLELSEDIGRHLDRLPVRARPDTVGYRVGKFLKRHTLGVAAAGLVALSLIAGMATTTWQAKVARDERAKAQSEQLRAQQVSEFLVELFQVVDPSEARGNTVTAREILDRGSEKISTELADQPEVQATLMDTMGTVYYSLGLYDRARELTGGGLEIRSRQLGDEHPDVASSLINLASVLRRQGDYCEAERLNREALTILRAKLGESHRTTLEGSANLALVLGDQARFEEAEQLLRDGLKQMQSDDDADPVLLSVTLNDLATVLSQRGRFADAEPLLREALELARAELGDDHPQIASYLNNLAEVISVQGRYEEAEQIYRETLALRRRLLGDEHMNVATSLNNLATVLGAQARFAEAEELYRESLGILRRVLGEPHSIIALALSNLGENLDSQGRPEEAEPLLREAVAMTRTTLGDRHPQLVMCLNNLAAAIDAQGRHAEAEQIKRDLLVLLRELFGDDHYYVAAALNNLAMSAHLQGRNDEAEHFQREALPIFRAQMGERHPQVGGALTNLAGYLMYQGKDDEAEPLFREAIALFRETLPPQHPELARPLLDLGSLLTGQSRAEEAEALLREAVDIRRGAMPEGDWQIADVESALGACLTGLGRYAEAEPLLLTSHAALEAELGPQHRRTQRARSRVADLYRATGRPAEQRPPATSG